MEAKFLDNGVVTDVIDVPPNENADVRSLVSFCYYIICFLIGAMEYAWKMQRQFRKHSYTYCGNLLHLLTLFTQIYRKA